MENINLNFDYNELAKDQKKVIELLDQVLVKIKENDKS